MIFAFTRRLSRFAVDVLMFIRSAHTSRGDSFTAILKEFPFVCREICHLPEPLKLRHRKLIYLQGDSPYFSVNAWISSSLVFFKPSMLFPVILFSIRLNMLLMRSCVSSRFWLMES